jgi:hypothetical protein
MKLTKDNLRELNEKGITEICLGGIFKDTWETLEVEE